MTNKNSISLKKRSYSKYLTKFNNSFNDVQSRGVHILPKVLRDVLRRHRRNHDGLRHHRRNHDVPRDVSLHDVLLEYTPYVDMEPFSLHDKL